MQRQLTPHYVLEPVRSDLGGIGLDPCTEPDNPTGADAFYTVADDGLHQPWITSDWRPTIYVNPPYGKAREPWVLRCMDAGARGQKVVLLIPAHTDTRIWHQAMETASAVCFIKGRVKFGVLRENRRQEAASHPSALISWNVTLDACAELGHVVTLGDRDLADSEEAPEPPCPTCKDTRVVSGAVPRRNIFGQPIAPTLRRRPCPDCTAREVSP